MDGNAHLSAAERRERRMKRILGEGENRIKKILSGPSGDEQRLPPMLEGGEYKSMINNSSPEEINSDPEPIRVTEIQPEECLLSRLSNCSVLSKVQSKAAPFNLLFGVFMRLLMIYDLKFNILIPWALFFFGSRFSVIIHDVPEFLTDVAVLIRSKNYCGIESVLKRLYAAFSSAQLFISHLLIMVCGYLFTHAGIILLHQISSESQS